MTGFVYLLMKFRGFFRKIHTSLLTYCLNQNWPEFIRLAGLQRRNLTP